MNRLNVNHPARWGAAAAVAIALGLGGCGLAETGVSAAASAKANADAAREGQKLESQVTTQIERAQQVEAATRHANDE